MIKMKKIPEFLLIIAFLLLQVYLFFLKNFDVLDYSHYINQHPLPLYGETKYAGQEFRSPGPLSRIDLLMANYKIKPKAGTLRLSILKGKQRLFLKNYPANTIEDNRFYSFNFNTANIPAGNYRLQLNYFPQNKKDKLAVWTSTEDLYPFGHLDVNGTRQKGDMTFRVYYASTIWKEKARWLSQSPQSTLRSVTLAASVILLLLLLNFLFYYFIRKLLNPNLKKYETQSPEKSLDND
jgi:hypothetical protein